MKKTWITGTELPAGKINSDNKSVVEFNEQLEASRVYDTDANSVLVCTVNEHHPDFEKNAKLIVGAKQMFNTVVLIAARDGYQYLYDLVEIVTGERWSVTKMNEEAIKIRKETGIEI